MLETLKDNISSVLLFTCIKKIDMKWINKIISTVEKQESNKIHSSQIRPRGYKTFLSMKFFLLINVKMSFNIYMQEKKIAI